VYNNCQLSLSHNNNNNNIIMTDYNAEYTFSVVFILFELNFGKFIFYQICVVCITNNKFEYDIFFKYQGRQKWTTYWDCSSFGHGSLTVEYKNNNCRLHSACDGLPWRQYEDKLASVK
jgi:hypothetical protein